MRAALFPLVTALAVAVLAPLRSAQAGSDEATVQAAFVANFARFTQWPAAVSPHSGINPFRHAVPAALRVMLMATPRRAGQRAGVTITA